MPRTRIKAKSRRESGGFVPLPFHVLENKNFILLSAKATKLLIDICSQIRFKGSEGIKNNGDLCATFSVMKERGWASHESLEFALKELLYYGFIKITRYGGRRKCHLYAVTWWAIDECNGKLDIPQTNVPSSEWKTEKSKWKRPRRN